MRAMHKGLHRAYSALEHDTCATIKAVYSVSYKLPAPPCNVAKLRKISLQKNAVWEGNKYGSWRLPSELLVQGVSGDWCNDFKVLDIIGIGHQQDVLIQTVCVCVHQVTGGNSR